MATCPQCKAEVLTENLAAHRCVSKETLTLADALPREMARVRDELLPMYLEIGPPGAFAVAMMRRDLDEASRAMMAGDTVAMLRVYQSLKETTG